MIQTPRRNALHILASFAVLLATCVHGAQHKIVIMGLNDIHGALASRKQTTAENVPYRVGGTAVLAGYANILKREFGDSLVILDAGDEWQGSMESNLSKGKNMVTFFNMLGVGAATIGNHEFDFGPERKEDDVRGALKARLLEAKYPYVSANIYEKRTGRLLKLPNLFPHAILNVGGIKVGIIGLTTEETPYTTMRKHVLDLDFRSLAEMAQREAKDLRGAGAQVIIALAHAGGDCKEYHRGRAKAADEEVSCRETEKNRKDEIIRFVNQVPTGTIDAVVSGHTHTVLKHSIHGVPVVQGGKFGEFFNLIYLTYDDTKGLVRELTEIEGPVPVCEKIFENQDDCDGRRTPPKGGRGKLVQPIYHGQKVLADGAVARFVDAISAKIEADEANQEPIANAANLIRHGRGAESPLGNLVADAMREELHTDFALMNSGGIRDNIEKGPIKRPALFRALPFENNLSRLHVTGKELKVILRVAQSGVKGVYSVSGLKLTLLRNVPPPDEDLNGDKKIEAWEAKRLVSVETSDGKPIQDGENYTLATVDFLATGGDYLEWPMEQIGKDRIELVAGGTLRESVEQYLKKKYKDKDVNAETSPLVDPKSPRIIFVDNPVPKNKSRSLNR